MKLVSQWEIDVMDERQEKHIVVLEAEQYDQGFPPAPLAEFQEWLSRLVEQIPVECRETAAIEFSSTGSYYDSHYGNVEVSYRRMETDEEMAARKADVLARYEAQQAQNEAAERHALKVLKAKYEA